MFGLYKSRSSFLIRLAICAALVLPFSASAQDSGSGVAAGAFVQGTKAFSAGEWMSSIFQLRKAVSYPENNNAETWYMLIAAEMYAGEYKNAFQDCERYLSDFSGSPYTSYVLYHKGRALFFMGEYENSILVLSDFCHQYSSNEMYASALYWIAESFFAGYNYDEAKLLYETVVNEYPDDAKAPAARFRIDTIAQSFREEKLLYLLKETGEEYLAAKEEYERQLKYAGAENYGEARRRILDLQKNASDLEKKVQELTDENSALKAKIDEHRMQESEAKRRSDEFIIELKRKALQAQELLDGKNSALNPEKSK